MNPDENEEELVDWDKRNITRFAQYLYNLAKEKVKQDKDLDDEVLEEVLKKVEEEVKEEVKEKVREKVRERVLVGLKEELPPVTVSDYDLLDEKTKREQTLKEVTIGLAKAVEGEEIEEATVFENQDEIREIIEKEQIPIPSDELETTYKPEEKLDIGEIFETEAHFTSESIEEVVEEIVEATIESLEPIIEEHIFSLEPVNLSDPIVTDPIIDEEVLIQPSIIPEDIHKIIFVDEVTSVPITEEEVIEMEEIITIKPVEEVAVVEPVEEVAVVEPSLDEQQIQRREEIIQLMLAETHKREQEEGFAVRELGETEGRAYSAIIVGNESNRNVKKWRKWERIRLKEEAKRAKKFEREQRKKKK